MEMNGGYVEFVIRDRMGFIFGSGERRFGEHGGMDVFGLGLKPMALQLDSTTTY